MKRKVLIFLLALMVSGVMAAGCNNGNNNMDIIADTGENTVNQVASDYDTEAGTQINLASGSVTISKAGTYVLSGTLEDGQVVVDCEDKAAEIVLILNGADITCNNSAAIYVAQAKAVTIIAAEGTVNKVSDGTEYSKEAVNAEITGAIFSKADLVIDGTGTLEVTGNYKHGIVSKDTLTISNVTTKIVAASDAIRGKDSVQILSGIFDLNAGGDGIQSNNDKDAELGYVYIKDGTFQIVSGNDGIQAETNLTIDGGSFEVITAGGPQNAGSLGDESAKGLKAGTDINLNGGSYKLQTADDAVHSNGNVTVEEGCSFSISTGDDGIHADAELTINGGNIVVSQCYEGLEGKIVTINGGEVDVTASDDGMNAAGGNAGDMGMGRFGADNFAEDGEVGIIINGGKVMVNASGDGIDSNQSLEINGGEVYVNGPTGSGDAALDFEARYGGTINGGTVIAVGSSGMVENMSSESKQCSITAFMGTTILAGTELTVKAGSGEVLMTFTPAKDWQCAILSHPDMKQGETYTITAGDTSVQVTMESVVATYGQSGQSGKNGGFDRGMRPGNMPGEFDPENMSGEFNPENMPSDFNPENMRGGKGNWQEGDMQKKSEDVPK